jgi:hypothetical protein
VEHDRKAATRPSKWGVKAGVLYGNNIMVKLLTQFRDSIRPKRTHSEVVGHVTLEQSVDARFKKSKAGGQGDRYIRYNRGADHSKL